MNDLAPEYVTARRVLPDALDALEGHLDNLILVAPAFAALVTDLLAAL